MLSIRGLRCSVRSVTYRDGREVDSCRNWSAKNRGVIVVFSLRERLGGFVFSVYFFREIF